MVVLSNGGVYYLKEYTVNLSTTVATSVSSTLIPGTLVSGDSIMGIAVVSQFNGG